jgi:hypothetical protein
MSENGKGSTRRGNSPEERRRFESGWDRAFGKKRRKQKAKG